MKKNKILIYIISISFIFTAFLGTVHFCCFDENFYTKQHDKILLYGKHINEHIGINNEELKDLTHFTLEYLNDSSRTLDLKMNINGQEREVFTHDEKAHMVDVRKLNLGSVYLCIFSAFIFVTSLMFFIFKVKEYNLLYKGYIKTLIYAGVTISCIAIWVLIDFDSFWTLFHHIFFSGNDLWLLDLRTDILIMIVPPEFFNNLVIRIIELFILSLFMFWFILYLSKRKLNNHD